MKSMCMCFAFNGFEVFAWHFFRQLGLWYKLLCIKLLHHMHYMLIAACTLPAVMAVETMFISAFGRAFSVLVSGCGK